MRYYENMSQHLWIAPEMVVIIIAASNWLVKNPKWYYRISDIVFKVKQK